MLLKNMDSGGGILEVPFVCVYCGGRSPDLETLQTHIRNEHQKASVGTERHIKEEPKPSDEEEEEEEGVEYEDEINPLLLGDLVEVQLKEEPDFLVPLDLTKKVGGAQIWIKQEPGVPYEREDGDWSDGESSDESCPETTISRISVGNQTALDSSRPPPLLKTPIYPPPALHHQRLLLAKQRNIAPRSNYLDNMIKARLIVPTPPMPVATVRVPRPPPPLIALTRPTVPMVCPMPLGPPPRLPTSFPTPHFIEVPYVCYHCGGRSQTLDMLRQHITTMHIPQMECRAELARRKLLGARPRMVRLKIPKPPRLPKLPKVPKEKKVKMHDEQLVPKLKIKIPKPPSRDRTHLPDDNDSETQDKMAELENKKPFSCPHCNFRSKTFRGLFRHAQMVHEKEIIKKRQAEEDNKSLKYKKSWKSFFFCLFCKYKTMSKNVLKKHIDAIHAKAKQHQCPYCNHKSAYAANMRWHIMKHLTCQYCDFKCASYKVLKYHENNECIGRSGGSGCPLPGMMGKPPKTPERVSDDSSTESSPEGVNGVGEDSPPQAPSTPEPVSQETEATGSHETEETAPSDSHPPPSPPLSEVDLCQRLLN